MALNMNNKKGLMDKIVPSAEISLNVNGINVSSERIAVPRALPFDIVGKCRECKATEVEADWCISKEGVTIWCSRFKINPRFVPFDLVYELPGYTFFKIKNRARVFNLDHGNRADVCSQPAPPVYHLPPPPPPPPQLPKRKHTTEKQADASEFFEALSTATGGIDDGKVPSKRLKQADASEFFGELSAATTGIAKQTTKTSKQQKGDASEFLAALTAATTGLNNQTQQPIQQNLQMKEQTDQEVLNEFFESVSAATTLLDTSQKKKFQKKKKKEMEDEEASAIASITPKP